MVSLFIMSLYIVYDSDIVKIKKTKRHPITTKIYFISLRFLFITTIVSTIRKIDTIMSIITTLNKLSIFPLKHPYLN